MVSFDMNHGWPVMMRGVIDWNASSFFQLLNGKFKVQARPANVIMSRI